MGKRFCETGASFSMKRIYPVLICRTGFHKKLGKHLRCFIFFLRYANANYENFFTGKYFFFPIRNIDSAV